jgi:Spy/CpxP family protein refolding chaperone
MTDVGSVLPQQIMDQLSLTAGQQTKLKDLDAKLIKERDQLLEQQRADGKDVSKLRADMTATRDSGDATKIEKIHGKIMELFQPQLDLRKKYQDDFKTSLTDEQKNKLDYALEQMMQRPGSAPLPGVGGAGK